MKLLLDENLSDRIIPKIIDLYPGSIHVKSVSLIHADDIALWDFAKAQGCVIVSKDWDFHQLSLLKGFPPKVIYLDIGNCPSDRIVNLLRKSSSDIEAFYQNSHESLLILDQA